MGKTVFKYIPRTLKKPNPKAIVKQKIKVIASIGPKSNFANMKRIPIAEFRNAKLKSLFI